MCCSRCGVSKHRRNSCVPRVAARQPSPKLGNSADSTGCAGSSEVISTIANCSKGNHPLLEAIAASGLDGIICLRMGILFHEFCTSMPLYGQMDGVTLIRLSVRVSADDGKAAVP